jgi:mRNA interferase MazF
LGRDVNRGDVCWYTFKVPDKKRPVLILTRDSAIAVLNSVTVAPITATIRSIPTEVVLTKDDGMPDTCAANFDNLQTVPKSRVGNRITRLTARKMMEARTAVSFALGFDDV